MSHSRNDLRQKAQLAISGGKKGMMHAPEVMLELIDAADMGMVAVQDSEALKEQITDLKEVVKEAEETIQNLKSEGKVAEVLAELNAAWAERDEWKKKFVDVQKKLIGEIRSLNGEIAKLKTEVEGDEPPLDGPGTWDSGGLT